MTWRADPPAGRSESIARLQGQVEPDGQNQNQFSSSQHPGSVGVGSNDNRNGTTGRPSSQGGLPSAAMYVQSHPSAHHGMSGMGMSMMNPPMHGAPVGGHQQSPYGNIMQDHVGRAFAHHGTVPQHHPAQSSMLYNAMRTNDQAMQQSAQHLAVASPGMIATVGGGHVTMPTAHSAGQAAAAAHMSMIGAQPHTMVPPHSGDFRARLQQMAPATELPQSYVPASAKRPALTEAAPEGDNIPNKRQKANPEPADMDDSIFADPPADQLQNSPTVKEPKQDVKASKRRRDVPSPVMGYPFVEYPMPMLEITFPTNLKVHRNPFHSTYYPLRFRRRTRKGIAPKIPLDMNHQVFANPEMTSPLIQTPGQVLSAHRAVPQGNMNETGSSKKKKSKKSKKSGKGDPAEPPEGGASGGNGPTEPPAPPPPRIPISQQNFKAAKEIAFAKRTIDSLLDLSLVLPEEQTFWLGKELWIFTIQQLQYVVTHSGARDKLIVALARSPFVLRKLGVEVDTHTQTDVAKRGQGDAQAKTSTALAPPTTPAPPSPQGDSKPAAKTAVPTSDDKAPGSTTEAADMGSPPDPKEITEEGNNAVTGAASAAAVMIGGNTVGTDPPGDKVSTHEDAEAAGANTNTTSASASPVVEPAVTTAPAIVQSTPIPIVPPATPPVAKLASVPVVRPVTTAVAPRIAAPVVPSSTTPVQIVPSPGAPDAHTTDQTKRPPLPEGALELATALADEWKAELMDKRPDLMVQPVDEGLFRLDGPLSVLVPKLVSKFLQTIKIETARDFLSIKKTEASPVVRWPYQPCLT